MLLLLALACAPDAPAGKARGGEAPEEHVLADPGGEPIPDEGCGVRVDGLRPADGEAHDYREPIVAQLSGADETASLALVDGAGAPVPGTLTVADRVLSLQPDAPLDPLAPYVAALSWCGGTAEVVFETSALGTPTEGCAAGGAWLLDLEGARVETPASLTPYVLGSLEDRLVLGVDAVGPDEATLRLAWSRGTGGAQDFCRPTVEAPAAAWTDPHFETPPVDLIIREGGADLVLAEAVLAGDLAADCRAVGGLRLDAQLDARRLGERWEAVLETDDPALICVAFAGFGVDCGPCTSDGAPWCVDLRLAGITGAAAEDPLACVAAEACHPLCPANDGACDETAYPGCG